MKKGIKDISLYVNNSFTHADKAGPQISSFAYILKDDEKEKVIAQETKAGEDCDQCRAELIGIYRGLLAVKNPEKTSIWISTSIDYSAFELRTILERLGKIKPEKKQPSRTSKTNAENNDVIKLIEKQLSSFADVDVRRTSRKQEEAMEECFQLALKTREEFAKNFNQ